MVSPARWELSIWTPTSAWSWYSCYHKPPITFINEGGVSESSWWIWHVSANELFLLCILWQMNVRRHTTLPTGLLKPSPSADQKLPFRMLTPSPSYDSNFHSWLSITASPRSGDANGNWNPQIITKLYDSLNLLPIHLSARAAHKWTN